jgi:hypothetical protein
MIWKRLNSDFVYKCHSGIPKNSQHKLKDSKYYEEFVNKKMIKFFIQFSSVQKNPRLKYSGLTQPEYLCSIIWIKGST